MSVRSMARELQATELMDRIEGIGDLFAVEAKYHLTCLTDFRKRYRSLIRQRDSSKDELATEKKFRARAFVELVVHI